MMSNIILVLAVIGIAVVLYAATSALLGFFLPDLYGRPRCYVLLFTGRLNDRCDHILNMLLCARSDADMQSQLEMYPILLRAYRGQNPLITCEVISFVLHPGMLPLKFHDTADEMVVTGWARQARADAYGG